MTAHEILLETVRLRGEDVTDTAVLADYNAVALVGMNEGYRDICSRIVCPTAWHTMTLDANKKFALATLTNTPQKILDICKYIDYTSASNWRRAQRYGWTMVDAANAVVPDADASGTVYVLYQIMPADLVNAYPVAITGHTAGEAATSPALLPAQFHRALAFKANAAIHARDGIQSSSMLWEAKYMAFLESLEPVKQQTEIESYYVV